MKLARLRLHTKINQATAKNEETLSPHEVIRICLGMFILRSLLRIGYESALSGVPQVF